ncbi:hypothetical protein [Caballeronia novacaledonica]|uniref:Uncharacterized protein n=1 Tax=Caballeronia novacaledonica TaxID=1544861 RepID=A0AA37IHS0_9BURK|nr:hypothetical protein [Caballeronia novacaledonica]GJH28944.1 hypothetical protein CBA19CS42_30530 [Caballeronia novacaledonica]
MLDKLELPLVQDITTHDRRVLVEHKPPGMAGSLVQNLGREGEHIVISGVATGPDALATTQQLDDLFRSGAPVPFLADIVADADLQLVLVEDLHLKDLAGKPQRFAYTLTLREYIEPVKPQTLNVADNDLLGDILDDARDKIDEIADGIAAIDSIAPQFERFVTQISDLLARLKAAASQ